MYGHANEARCYIHFHLICQMLAKFSAVEFERTVSKFRKRTRKFCVLFTYFIKRRRETSKFHVAVVQRQLRNVKRKKKRNAREKLLFC